MTDQTDDSTADPNTRLEEKCVEITQSVPRDPVALTRRPGQPLLEPAERAYIIRALAGFAKPAQVRQGLLEEFDREVSLNAIINYRDKDKWAKEIQKERKQINKHLETIPICSQYWRMAERMRLIELAKRSKGELSVARGLIMDAARELGEVQDGRTGNGPNVQVNILAHIQGLEPLAALRYAQTGELPAASWTSDAIEPPRVVSELETTKAPEPVRPKRTSKRTRKARQKRTATRRAKERAETIRAQELAAERRAKHRGRMPILRAEKSESPDGSGE